MVVTLCASTSKLLAEAEPGGLRHDHDPVGQICSIVEHGPLMRRRVCQNGVGDQDGGNLESAQDLEHLVSIGTPVEAVLVLDDCDIGLVQCAELARTERGDPFTNAAMTRSLFDICPMASTTCTTLTSESCADNPDARAALNVARPHGVGG